MYSAQKSELNANAATVVLSPALERKRDRRSVCLSLSTTRHHPKSQALMYTKRVCVRAPSTTRCCRFLADATAISSHSNIIAAHYPLVAVRLIGERKALTSVEFSYCFPQISQNLLSHPRTEDLLLWEIGIDRIVYLLGVFWSKKKSKNSNRAVTMVCSIDDIVSRRPGKHTRFPTVVNCSLLLFVVFFNSARSPFSLSFSLSHLLWHFPNLTL